ncbi:hypothetical protein [uncultured Brevundimonas sp.]|uniref:hypothetical protein n=1 Tax=uncultured Brevundimonas sp. TaxID=213418 RepID=UPI0030EC463B|tara:strand:- start:2082 stop:2669 length:588 start_codon:yes stop_codon:yes gene_type:complete
MGNLARKLIDAIQHSLLGSLFLAILTGVMPFVPLAIHLTPHETVPWIGLPLFGLIIVAAFMAWLVGAVANRRPRRLSPLHALQLDPPPQAANGFEAWSELPTEGLRPPPLMRGIVTLIGMHPEQEERGLEVTVALAAMGLLFLLSFAGSDVWQRLYPALAKPSARLLPALGCLAFIAASVVRGWASTQRKLLAPQ